MNQVDISVVVTTYKRPKMVKDLILSYVWQSYSNSELVIIDDCVDDTETKRLVEGFIKKDARIRFIKNPANLGYSKNFLKSLTEARGKYIIILGDDDIFLHCDVLKKYVEVFKAYPRVGFIYSNILQFNQEYKMDYVYRHFENSMPFQAGRDSLEHIWLKSCYIPGIGLRNNLDFIELYPKENWLFPQVELIGKILATHEAYGFADYLIGGRAHQDQLGFEAVKGRRIKKTERHASVELLEIFETLKAYYQRQGVPIDLSNDFVKKFFAQSHATILPTEKINTGNRNLLRIFFEAARKNKALLLDGKYLFFMMISLLLPKNALLFLKNWYKNRLVKKHWSHEKDYFEKSVCEIGLLET